MIRPTTLVGCLLQHAELNSERCAVASRPVSLSYAELAERVVDQARRLGEAGVSDTSVVAIECDEDVTHLILCLAVAHIGATSCTVASFESRQQQESVLLNVGAGFVLRKDSSLGRVPASQDNRTDPVLLGNSGAGLLFSTSGTTGRPKIVCHHEAGLVAQAPRHVNDAEERFSCLASMEHNFSKRHRLYCAAMGATNVFLDAAPETLVDHCQSLGLTTMHLSAFQAQELLAVPGVEALRGMRLKLGGSHVSASLRQRLKERITEELHCGYGTTETGAIAFTDPCDEGAHGSVGRALPGIEIRVTNADRRPLKPGERGEVAIRCEGMFLGYLGQSDLTAERLTDGWFHTGDVAHLDEQGRLHLGGRSDDMFVFNSINIHPQDLEKQIREYPTVVDAVVIPHPSPVHGDVPVALVVHDGPGQLDSRGLRAFVRERVGVRCPRRFTVVDRIPRNDAGKILRDAARALLSTDGARQE